MTDDSLVPVPITMPFRGRDLKMVSPDPAQFAMMLHQARRLQRGEVTGAEALRSLDVLQRIVLSRFVIKEDREFIEDLIIDGDVGTIDLVELATGAFKKMTEGLKTEPQKPAVRRGRPRKATS